MEAGLVMSEEFYIQLRINGFDRFGAATELHLTSAEEVVYENAYQRLSKCTAEKRRRLQEERRKPASGGRGEYIGPGARAMPNSDDEAHLAKVMRHGGFPTARIDERQRPLGWFDLHGKRWTGERR